MHILNLELYQSNSVRYSTSHQYANLVKKREGKKDSTTKVFAPRITDDHHLETPSEDLGILRETRDDSGKAPAYGIPAQ